MKVMIDGQEMLCDDDVWARYVKEINAPLFITKDGYAAFRLEGALIYFHEFVLGVYDSGLRKKHHSLESN
jgi:hypothetical protein